MVNEVLTGFPTNIGSKIFIWMLTLAMILHFAVLGVVQLWPQQDFDIEIPHVLNFKIGASSLITLEEDAQEAAATPKPATKPVTKKTRHPVENKIKKAAESPSDALHKKQPKRVEITPPAPNVPKAQRRAPSENASASLSPAELLATSSTKPNNLPSLRSLFDNIAQETAQQKGAALVEKSQAVAPQVPQGVSAAHYAQNAGLNDAQTAAIRLRYEQRISAWVAQQRYYPKGAGGRSGRAIVRVRVDRSGYVRYYTVEKTSGYAIFDSAAIDMIRKANPMPHAPKNYPAGNLIEFLIPITFKP
jgi:TonB family protein